MGLGSAETAAPVDRQGLSKQALSGLQHAAQAATAAMGTGVLRRTWSAGRLPCTRVPWQPSIARLAVGLCTPTGARQRPDPRHPRGRLQGLGALDRDPLMSFRFSDSALPPKALPSGLLVGCWRGVWKDLRLARTDGTRPVRLDPLVERSCQRPQRGLSWLGPCADR